MYLVCFHSQNRDGKLSFTDFNQMVLPTCNQVLRAKATQRQNIFMHSNGRAEFESTRARKKLVQLLVAEICFNLDLENFKNQLEKTQGGFSTKQLFELIDIRQYNYLDMQAVAIFMSQFYATFVHSGEM